MQGLRYALLFTAMALLGCQQRDTAEPALDIHSALGGGDTTGFDLAEGERAFFFPKDHGPHLKFRQEWWYVTGNLKDEENHLYGFQVTFFRVGLSPDEGKHRKSAWEANQIYMAHFAVTDGENGRFYPSERFARDAIGLAGASLFPFRVWVEDWQLAAAVENDWPWQLKAQQKDVSLQLNLERSKREVLHGDKGLSRKSAGKQQASYYYSISRIDVNGSLRIGDRTHNVRGLAWLDREWSTSSLSEEQEGWDWFALQLKDNTEIMFYRIRRKDGGIDAASQGTYIDYNNDARSILMNEIDIQEVDRWKSPHSGIVYPSRWKLALKSLRKTYDIVPLIPDQELNLSVRYWEGAVRVLDNGHEIGRGYVELVGYGQ